MARSQRRRATSALRQGLLIHLERMQERFPRDSRVASIRHVQSGGSIELDTGTVFSALYMVNPTAARPFNNQADPNEVRRWLLTEDDQLLELDARGVPPPRPRRDRVPRRTAE